MVQVIYPSAGHHVKDPGAVYNGIKEADKNIELRNLVTTELKCHKHITDIDHETNTQYQNRIKPGVGSVLLDLHFNASSNTTATGVEIIISNNANSMSKEMARELAEGTACILGITNRGVKTEKQTSRGKIGILNLGAGIAVLVEVCFISNPNDMLKYEAGKYKLAKFYAQIAIKYDQKL